MTQNNNQNQNQKPQNDRQAQQGNPRGQFPNKGQPQPENKRREDERRQNGPNRPMSDQH